MRFALVAVGLLLVPYTTAETPPFPHVEVVGMRTGVTYSGIDPALASARACPSCVTPVPANEWLWLEVSKFESDAFSFTISVNYLDATGPSRTLSVNLLTSDFTRIPIPAARPLETAIVVRLSASPGVSMGDPWEATFPVAGELPVDPREIRLAPVNRWEHYSITVEPEDVKVFFLFAASQRASDRPHAWFIDYNDVASFGEWHASGYDLDGTPMSLQVSASPLSLGLHAVPTTFLDLGAYAALSFGGWIPVERVDVTYGIVGPADARDEILMFSVNDTFRVETTASGELWTVGSDTQGVRVRSEAASAQVGARVESRATFDEASFVIAQASGGTFGSGTASIRHKDNFISSTIANLAHPLVELSHGDCSGEWSAKLTGTSVSGPDTFDASMLAAKDFTPSPRMIETWRTDNGWCA